MARWQSLVQLIHGTWTANSASRERTVPARPIHGSWPGTVALASRVLTRGLGADLPGVSEPVPGEVLQQAGVGLSDADGVQLQPGEEIGS